MKRILCLSILLTTAGILFAQKDNQDKKPQGSDNKVPQEIRYKEGSSGVKRSINYRFDSSTADSDPGSGAFRYNSESVSKVSYIYVNNSDLSGEDQSKWYKTWDDTTGATGRGRISIVEYEGKNANVFDVSGVFTSSNGFWKIPVEYLSGSRPATGSTYYYVFERIAHKKLTAGKDPVVEIVAEVIKPVEEVKPVEQPKPVEEVKPVEKPKVVEEVKPVEQHKPVEEVKPVEQPKVVEEVKPVEQPKPVEEVKQVDQPKPVEDVKPVEQPKPVEEVKPVEQPKPVEEVKPVEQPKPVEEVKPVEQPKPVEEVKPVEQPKPVEEVKPVEQPKPVEEVKPVEKPKPVEEIKPAEQPIAADEVKPVIEDNKPVFNSGKPLRETSRETVNRTNQAKPGIPRKGTTQTQRTPVTQTRTAQTRQITQPVQNTTNTARNTNQTTQTTTAGTQRSGTTWTSQVTQGVQPAQEPPAQSNTSNNRLPSYGYNFSSNRRSHGKCYAGIIEVGYGMGLGDYGLDNFRLNFINGFHIGPTFTLGLGIGVRRYYPEHENYTDRELISKMQIPVFVDLRKTFSTKTITPYIALDLGGAARYSAQSGSTETVNEGLLVNPSAGIWINLSSRFALFGGIGYELQKMEFLNTDDDSHYKKNVSSVSLNIGISF